MVYKGRKALVIGLGASGKSAAKFLLRRGALVDGFDDKPLPASEDSIALMQLGMTVVCNDTVGPLEKYDIAVVSPGVSPTHPLYQNALNAGIEVIGEIELACREIKHRCLGVTGTNGKTTVTLLIEHILRTKGIEARALGNIGVPLTSAIDEIENENTTLVIELSSFQLETLETRFLDAGIILNITPDHLDRYASMHDYAAAKIGMKKNIKKEGKLFTGEKCLNDFRELFEGSHNLSCGYSSQNTLYCDLENVYFQGDRVFTLPEELQGKSSHDIENIMGAFALCKTLSVTPEEFLIGLASFHKPAHRIEFVRTVRGVNFYDDSKGTNVDAVIRAVESLKGQIVLIAGGVDKGSSYIPWIEAFQGKVKAICAIGQSKEKIKNELKSVIPVELFSDFSEAVVHAADLAEEGDHVLLSPGCSSFDMFKDYVHRGMEFQRIVHAFF